jgi:antitoxin (DNA-binding transcriptional repressor) of toxin-antitoxin stability system
VSTKTIDSTDLRNNLGESIDLVGKGETLLVKRRGQLKAALIDIDTLEDLLEAGDPKYVASIKKARADYKSRQVFSLDEVFGNI